MRVTTAFKRLMDLPGVTVSEVDFQPAKVVVTVRLRSRRLCCPECGFSTRARYDTRPALSTWRHLDLGRWRLEVRAVHTVDPSYGLAPWRSSTAGEAASALAGRRRVVLLEVVIED